MVYYVLVHGHSGSNLVELEDDHLRSVASIVQVPQLWMLPLMAAGLEPSRRLCHISVAVDKAQDFALKFVHYVVQGSSPVVVLVLKHVRPVERQSAGSTLRLPSHAPMLGDVLE